jgi:lipopolysaccharide export system permease protein
VGAEFYPHAAWLVPDPDGGETLMFNLLQSYTMKSFLRSLFFTWVVLNAVVVSLLFGDKWDDLLDNKATTQQAITYFVCILPQTTLVVFPAVCMMGALFGMLTLARNNELAAMFAGGAGLRWLIRPTLILSVLIGIGTFAWNEYLAAPLSREGEQMMVTQIQKKSGVFKDYGLLCGTKRRFLRYGQFDKESGILTGFVLHEMRESGGGHRRFIRADLAAWDPSVDNPETGKKGAWILTSNSPESDNYVLEVFDDWRTEIRPLNPKGEILYIEESPDDFGIDQRRPIEMGYRELLRRIAILEDAGSSALALYPDLEFKIAFPFSVIALILIGLVSGASSFLTGREGAARFTYPLGACLIIMTLYYSFTGMCLAFGYLGYLDALVSAWLPNLVFGALGVLMLFRS